MAAALIVVAVALGCAVAALLVGPRGGSTGRGQEEEEDSPRRTRTQAGLALLGFAAMIAVVPVTLVHNAHRSSAKGAGGRIHLSPLEARGRTVFAQSCAQCHTLRAANAVGTTGPDLDVIRPSRDVVLAVVQSGLEGPNGTMPAGLATGRDAVAVAAFVAKVAGR